MAKKSQLHQLKSALSQQGLSQNSQNGKKRKKSVSEDTEKVKKAAKLQAIHKKLNQFDVKVTKLKHDVGGRRIKGAVGHPAQSKQAGIEHRKKTLLKEYEEKGRAGGILDRRFGENDPTMSIEDRMLERFTRERQRASKASTFNLQEEEELTHYGQSLSMLDDFDNVGIPMDDDEEEKTGQIGEDIVKHTHFGGFDDDDDQENNGDESDKKKSKAEVMAEVMAKSKEHKLLRQMEKEQGENMRHQLDQEFDSLRSLIYAPDPSSSGSNSIPLGTGRQPNFQDDATDTQERLQEVDDYDQQVRELVFEKRAKAKDRTKTEEEIALEEKEALEKAEKQRRKRMMGEDVGDSDEDEPHGRKKRKRPRGGDDLDDDFLGEDDGAGIGTGLGEVGALINDVEMSEDEDEDESEGSDDDDGEADIHTSDDGGAEDTPVDEDDDENSEGEEEGHAELTTKQKSRISKPSASTEELPYTFPCPDSHEDFLEIVDELKDEVVPTVVQRIRTLYHPSLGPDNKFKLQILAHVLIDHILYITSPPTPRFTLLSALLPHLYGLCKSYPIETAEYFIEKLSLMHKNLKRGLSQGALNLEARTWPGIAELTLLRVTGTVWSSSDMKHAVISLARLLMGSYLALCRVRSLVDIASGLFLCTLFLQYEELSRRLVPEAVNFAINVVLHLAPHSYQDASSLPGSFPSPDFRSELCSPLAINIKKAKKLTVRKPNLAQLLATTIVDEHAKLDLLGLAIDILDRFAAMHKSLEGFIELYQPINTILSSVDFNKSCPHLETRRTQLQDKLTRLMKFSKQQRRPLLLQAHKPIPIPTYIPKFETSTSSYMRHRDPDHDRNEAAKLRYQHKQERKGAIRELRKDAKFLAAVEQGKQKEKDHAYQQRMNKVTSSLEGERAEQKAIEREKAKEKRRAGRK